MSAKVIPCMKPANITPGAPSFQSPIGVVILQTWVRRAASRLSGGMTMIKLVTAFGAAALLALGAGTMGTPSSGCEMVVLNQDGQLIELVVCDDGSSFEVAHGEFRQDGLE